MKKLYVSPALEWVSITADNAIAEDPNSFPYNDGVLGWT